MASKRSDGYAPGRAPGKHRAIRSGADALRLMSLLLLAVATATPAASLYKSVARNGGITYSDVPQPGAVSVEEILISRSLEKRTPESAAGLPLSLSYSGDRYQADTRISRANADLDAAEYALAQARRPLWAMKKGLINADLRTSDVDYAQIAVLKDDVAEARKALVQAIRQRNALH